MFRKIIAPLLLILGLMPALPAQSSEQYVRGQMDMDVRRLFVARDFAALEARANEYRRTDARSPSGLQMLNLFYFSIRRTTAIELYNPDNWDSLIATADAWIETYPKSPTAVISKAVILQKRAGMYLDDFVRGTGTPETRSLFFAVLTEAETLLRETKSFASVDPAWYTEMALTHTYLNAPAEVFQANLAEGLERHPEYLRLYFTQIEYMRPRRHPNGAEELERFARYATEMTEETTGKALYARIYWFAFQTQYGVRLFTESNVSWDMMREGIYDVLKYYPDQWNIQHFTRFACLAGDAETTRDLLSRMGDGAIPDVWPGFTLTRCRIWAWLN